MDTRKIRELGPSPRCVRPRLVGWAGTGANMLGTALLAGAVFGEGSFTGAAIALGTSSALAVYNDLANSKYEFIRKG